MAEVVPFKGILYNKEKIGDFSQVVAPPYDVICPEENKSLRDRHPQNVVRLILCESDGDTADSSAFYRSSAKQFRDWLADGTLQTDSEPALYLTTLDFTIEGRQYQRHGFIAYVRLEPFEKKVVLPHERTSSKVKDDRLNLLKAAGANFCQIFSLYTDPEQLVVNTLVEAVAGKQPDIDLVDDAEERHRLWRITDTRTTDQVTTLLKEKQLYIADGHHRYETGLNYRNWVAENDPGFSENHPANFIMMSLSSTSDPGMLILPTHRLLLKVKESLISGSAWVQQAAKHFDIKEIPFDPANREKAELQLRNDLQSNLLNNAFGAVAHNQPVFYLLTLRPQALLNAFDDTIPQSLRSLDVTILSQLILKKIFGYSQTELDEEEVIDYTSDFHQAVEAAVCGQCQVAFLLNPTRNEQVQTVAAQGEIMPRKTTFYYPKLLTGLVFSDKKTSGR